MNKSTELFVAGLVAFGIEPVVLADKPDHLRFEYVVETGKHIGKKVRHGVIVPPDFPASWPSGPHVSPHIHPINCQGAHPTGAVHQSDFGEEWQYWSRPLQGAAPGKNPVARYLSHIFRLWDTQ